MRYTDSKFFLSLVAEHNNLDSHFHFNLFDPFVVCMDLNPKDFIVYITFLNIWRLCNFICNIGAGWLLQVSVGAQLQCTLKVARDSNPDMDDMAGVGKTIPAPCSGQLLALTKPPYSRHVPRPESFPVSFRPISLEFSSLDHT